jgi:hypothetical protein
MFLPLSGPRKVFLPIRTQEVSKGKHPGNTTREHDKNSTKKSTDGAFSAQKQPLEPKRHIHKSRYVNMN